MDQVFIFTDGGAWRNPGPGAWAAILYYKKSRKEVSGFETHTTNNRMEIMAAIGGLKVLKRPLSVHITTDSKYLQEGMTKWIEGWKKKGWKTAANKEVKNQDLWQELDALCSHHKVTWEWVRGHDGHTENEAADQLVQKTIEENVEKKTN